MGKDWTENYRDALNLIRYLARSSKYNVVEIMEQIEADILSGRYEN